jgi:hypothetical protein
LRSLNVGVLSWSTGVGSTRGPGGVWVELLRRPYADHWAEALLDWAAEQFGMRFVAPGGRVSAAAAVLAVARQVPLVLVLDGLEVAQEGPASDAYGRLLDGTLREVLTGLARLEHRSLVVLTSRFPFADLAGFDGRPVEELVEPECAGEGVRISVSDDRIRDLPGRERLFDVSPAAPAGQRPAPAWRKAVEQQCRVV